MKDFVYSAGDKELINDALGGSKTALEHLLKRHYNFIYNVALRFVRNPYFRVFKVTLTTSSNTFLSAPDFEATRSPEIVLNINLANDLAE
jgi:hypothetical protein